MDKIRGLGTYIFSSYKRVGTVLVVGALVLAIPFTINFLSQQQDIRQRASQVCSSVPTDTMLVIDRSGSMDKKVAGSNKTLLDKAKEAAISFVNITSGDTNNRVGVVAFASDKNTKLEIGLSSDFNQVKNKINSINDEDETCTQCGILKANAEIASKKRVNVKNAIILLTDGRANYVAGNNNRVDLSVAEQAAIDAAKQGFSQNNTPIFTIGLGPEVNKQFLEGVATLTGGKYFNAPTANDLQGIYQQISQILGKGSVSGFVFNDINANGVFDNGEQALPDWEVNLKLPGNTASTPAPTDTSRGNGYIKITFDKSKSENVNTTTVQFTKTNIAGGYSYEGLCDGNYSPGIMIKDGWTLTAPTTTSELFIVNGISIANQNFGVVQGSSTTHNTPFMMVDGKSYNWVYFNASEQNVSSTTVTITNQNLSDGTFSGTGFMNDLRDNNLNITGKVTGNTLTFNGTFTDGTGVEGNGIITGDGGISGPATGTKSLSTVTKFSTTVISATPTPPSLDCNSCMTQGKPYLCSGDVVVNGQAQKSCSNVDIIFAGNSMCNQCAPPTATPTVASTTTPADAIVKVNLSLTGLGNGSASAGLNNQPQRPTRIVNVAVYNSENQLVKNANGEVTFNPQNGLYSGNIALGQISSGPYTVRIRTDNTLWKTIPGIFTLINGQVVMLSPTVLYTGDINQDNQINILDYNLFISCLNGQCPEGTLTKNDYEDARYAFNVKLNYGSN